jgi:hypothetical protein
MGRIFEHGRVRLLVEARSRPGSTTRPAGRLAITSISAAVAECCRSSRGDHGIGGRLPTPGLGLDGERAVAALGRIDAAFGGESSATPP